MVWVPRDELWRQQPPIAHRLASRGIARRALFWASLHPSARWGIQDMVGRVEMGRSGVAGNTYVDGRLVYALNSTNFTFATPARLTSTAPCAITWLQQPGTQTSTYPFIFSVLLGGSDYLAVFESPSDSSYSFVAGRLGSSAISFSSAVGLMQSGRADRFVLVAAGGPTSSTPGDWTLWRNGEKLTAGGTIATGGDSGSGGRIGGSVAAAYPYVGALADFGIFEGVPTDSEIRAFFRAPDSVYAPRRGFVFMGAGGSASAAVTEAASAADAVSSVATWVAQALEAASAADVATAATTVLVDIAEAASAADAVSSVATWVAQALEAVSAAETLAAGYSAAASAAVTEAVSAADAVSSVATWVAQALEAASAADVATAATTVLAAMAEVAGPAEALTSTYSAAGAASIDEPAAAADSIVAAATVLAAVLEAGSAAEASTAATTWVALLTESAVPADGVAVPQTWSVSAAELAAAVEALSAAWLGSGGALTAPPIAGRLQVAVRFARQSATRAARAQRDSR